MLHEFLVKEQVGILKLCREKLLKLSASKDSSSEMELGLPLFYEELISLLQADEEASRDMMGESKEQSYRDSAARRGRESLRLRYTISQVVHGYGAICQAITEYATERATKAFEAREFNRLNFCLDVAIAEAVTEFSKGERENLTRAENERLGFLAHELRNALGNAALAHQMIKTGVVGLGGSTNQVLETALSRMKNIIDRSLAEVRLRGDPIVDRARCRIVDLVGEVEAMAISEASAKGIRLHVEIDADLVVSVDRHLIVSAISNLLQNAIKFTWPQSNVWLRARSLGDRVRIEVEDECRGLPPGAIEELFQPFSQKGPNKSGIGLGLSISRRAVDLNGGQLSAVDLPGKGCIFSIDLPREPVLEGEMEGLMVGGIH